MRFGDRRGEGEERGYHHGNLREALVEAALRLIAERGPGGFTFAEAARAAGVSPAAPYRHFRDQHALLAEVARRGFEQFTAQLERAWADGRPDPFAAFQRCGKAYLAFARANPAAYATMFGPAAAHADDPELRAAAERAFAVLRGAAEAVCAALPPGAKAPPLMVALHTWAISHGIAALFVGTPDAPRRPMPMAPEDLLEAAMLVYLHGLEHPADAG
jgi:AcrR family transcriptional regulator